MRMRSAVGLAGLVALTLCAWASEANAYGRQYYSSWSYYPSQSYHQSYYYYKPYVGYSGYKYHHCVYYPSKPQHVYYYNPVRRHYWGRFDCKGTPGAQYSLLKEEDRKEKIDDIPETAFPKPANMPAVPDSDDGETIAPIDVATLPKDDKNPVVQQ